MSRTKEEMREARKRKIERRRHLLSHLDHAGRTVDVKDGYFANSGEISKYITAGKSKKTKAKNGHASYRHKGTYGVAVDHSPRDKRQIDRKENNVNDS